MLDKITIENYKSIRDLKDLTLNRINILVGQNGSGKTNFLNYLQEKFKIPLYSFDFIKFSYIDYLILITKYPNINKFFNKTKIATENEFNLFSKGTKHLFKIYSILLLNKAPVSLDCPECFLNTRFISIISELIKFSKIPQIFIATQSLDFINYFSIEDLIIVNENNGLSTFDRKNNEDIEDWLNDGFSLGEIYKSGIIEGIFGGIY